MGFETPENQQAIRDIYAETRDGDLTEQEQQDIISRYETECQEIHDETCEGLDELHQMIQIFKEVLELSGEEISLLQRICGARVDGVFGPQSFERFIDYRQSIGFEGGPLQFQQIYQNFQALPRTQRERFQPEGGRDGIFGPDTFRFIVGNNLEGELGIVEETDEVLIPDDPLLAPRSELRPSQDGETGETPGEVEIGEEADISERVRELYESGNREQVYISLIAKIELGNTDVIEEYINAIFAHIGENGTEIGALQEYIHANNAYEMARYIFCNTPPESSENGNIYTVNFQGSNLLYQHITAFDIFGDSPYLQRYQGTFIRTYENNGDFLDLERNRLSIKTNDVLLLPNEERISEIQTALTRRERIGDAPDEDSSLGQEVIVPIQGREVTIFVRESTIGQERLNQLIAEGIISPETAEALERIMTQGNDRFFPVIQDGAIIFISNPTYAPDQGEYGVQNGRFPDRAGDGVSSQEAQRYAERYGYLLPDRTQADLARMQAGIRANMITGTPGNLDHVSRNRGVLEHLISRFEGSMIGGITKIWVFNDGIDPGLNGAYRDVRGEDVYQRGGHSRAHASNPSYADYSQAAQFVHPVRIDREGNVIGLEEFAELTSVSPEVPADEVITARIRDHHPEIYTPAEVHYNNGLQMTDEVFEAAKIEVLENGENPNYEEFRNVMNQLSLTEKQQFQELVRAEVDGVPGPNTYTHFMYSGLREAGFSLEEAASLRKVFSENAEEELQAIRDTYGLDENWPQLDMNETESLPFHITPGMFMDYDINYGVLTIYDPESRDVITQDVAEGTLDTIGNAFESGNPDEIYTTLERLGNNIERKNEYIAALKDYIRDNESYETARAFFTRTEQRDGEEVYIVDFRGDRDLIREMVAVDLFGDIPFLKNSGDEYLQFYEPERDFETLDRSSRLTIVDGVELFIPSPQEMEYLVRQEEIRSAVEDNISETLRSGDAQIIRDYFSLPTLRAEQKAQTLGTLRDTVFSERLFADMRGMFTTQEGENYTFVSGNDYLEENLKTFDLFGDYTQLESGGEVYTSENSREYYASGNNRLSIADGTVIRPIVGSERAQEDYERLNTPLERNRAFVREYVPENWQDQFMEFVARLPDNEILRPSDPITLADSSRREAMYLVNGEYRTFPVIFGSGGFSDGYIASGDRRTPRGVAHTFSSVRIASSLYGDASNGGSTTVLGASLQNGPLGSQGGGKWFHGVADHRIPGGATWGCVGMNVHIAREIARQIQANGNRGFGYVA